MAAPPSALTLPPPRAPRDYSWVKPVVLYGGIAGGVILVGYGVYTVLNNVSQNQNQAALNSCAAQWQSAFDAYQTQYKSYVEANGGAALTSTQTANLQGYVSIMNQAEQCILTAGNASTSTWATTLTDIAIAAAVAVGAVAAFRAYLSYRGGLVRSGSEARAAVKSAINQTEASSGSISTDDASGLNEQVASDGATEAAAEQSALGTTASANLDAATAADDTSLVDSIQSFITTVIDTIVDAVTAVYDYFAALLA
ncbi:MAG TPA: hypothetical protein VMG99_08915 [Thermoplasmata archaeon]|nr:hypothetical protein [Thermoplasmata archaeon]